MTVSTYRPVEASAAYPTATPGRHSRTMRVLAAVLVAGALALAAGCGKKGDPERPPGSEYPRTYPTPTR